MMYIQSVASGLEGQCCAMLARKQPLAFDDQGLREHEVRSNPYHNTKAGGTS